MPSKPKNLATFTDDEFFENNYAKGPPPVAYKEIILYYE
jgi:hypothetical protein